MTLPLTNLEAHKRAARSACLKARAELHEKHKLEAPLALARTGLDFTGLKPPLVVSGFHPFKSEIDVLPLLARLTSEGWATALPIVKAERQPLIFRQWAPGEPTVPGVWGIPMPAEDAPEVEPDVLLVPLLGFDRWGYRLGYGGGFFDRTLAALAKKPLAIGISYERARLETIHPQHWDIPMDYVVTERGVYRRDPEGLVFLGEPEPGSGTLASPVCYADEHYFGNPGTKP